ncbi:CD109 antigen-like [Portunus trituberculatus]|uniref:CD109 antigen-like n=1 Tax=Portunus trituberculatus TaxID=210409 RepID=UPI001E1CB04E|nr:CD109 antigen-like [Portunus trituberculatus]
MGVLGSRHGRGAALLTAALTVAVLWCSVEAQNVAENFYNRLPPGRLYPAGWLEKQQEVRVSAPSDKKTHAKWVIVAGRRVVPGSVYRVVVEALRVSEPLTVSAALIRSSEQITTNKVTLKKGEISEILLQAPYGSVPGDWQLRVEGHEGIDAIFKRVTKLEFQTNFLTIFMQPSRPVYTAGQTVYFRSIMLTRDLKPYDDPVDVYVLDPRGLTMRRWPSMQTSHGVINLNFELPEYPLVGPWTLRVQARTQTQDKVIHVEHYFRPRFEVFVRMPQTIKASSEMVEGVVVANMTNWRDVFGNLTIKLQFTFPGEYSPHPPHHDVPDNFTDVFEEFVETFRGYYPFALPLEKVKEKLGGSTDLQGSTVRVWAAAGDSFGWQVQTGWALARLVEDEAKVVFLGDQPLIFHPGMPITVQVFATYQDDHPFEEEELLGSKITVTISIAGGSTQVEEMMVWGAELAETKGVGQVTFDIPDTALNFKVDASLVTGSGLTASSTMVGQIQHSPRNRHLQIETSTPDAAPGQFITLHVRNNFYMEYFNFVVISEGVLVYSGREPVGDLTPPTITTFALPASAEMAPAARIVVWTVTQDGQLVSHAIAVPVNPLGRHEVGIRWNEHKDHSGGSVEMKMLGEGGAFFAVSSMWEETHLMDAGHELDRPRILTEMMRLDQLQDVMAMRRANTSVPHLRRASTRSRDGAGAWINFFPTSLAGPDAPTTFNFSHLIVLTDADLFYHPHHASEAPDCSPDQFKCLTGGCFSMDERCNGEFFCSDHSDEAGCPVEVDPMKDFRLYRLSRLNRFYDPIDGDWAWQDVRGLGSEIQVFPIPKRPQTWVVSMFAVGKELGLGVMQEKIQFDSAGPFMITLEGPSVARQWEQVGLRACVFNFHHSKVGVLLTLPESPDYRSVLVEEDGVVTSYKPRTATGERQHIVWLDAGESRDVHIPIVFTRKGTVEVEVIGSTMMQKDSDSVVIEVNAEGVSIGKHTSILLDLKNRALVYEFLDIQLDEVPEIPYSLDRRYIYDTPAGHISITGDVVGPAFPEVPVNSASLLGLEMTGAETAAYNFAANLWTLHYLRLTNQLQSSLTYRVLTAVNVEYAAIARYQDEKGAFKMWPDSEPSVWLTAYILRTLWLANFQDWENLIYIDPSVVNQATAWMLEYQIHNGAFIETPNYTHPLDSKTNPPVRPQSLQSHFNVPLTAQVVLTLVAVLPSVKGNTRARVNIAKANAIRYLEQEQGRITDPYEMALVAWALTKADSSKKESAFSRLHNMKREHGNKIYWSREPISFNNLVYEDNQRPFMLPKDDQKWDAHAVETTSYALLVYVARDGIGILQENIVRFLAVMRELDGGLISTLDSVMAMEALVEYSYRARLRDVTDMRITIEHSSDPNFTVDVQIDNTQRLAELRSFDLNNIYGHISVVGHGSGQALVQLDYSYGVDLAHQLDFPPVNSFEFSVYSQFYGRNNSHLRFTACQRWTYTEESETSGVAVVEMHLPSGYYVMQDDLIRLVQSRQVRNLRWAYRTTTQVKFFFNHLDTEETCVSYEVERWHPVANHSRYNMARVYDLYQPERFNMTLMEVYPLYDLDLCEVCGSYQCPYCPFYSNAPPQSPPTLLVLLLLVLALFLRSATDGDF